MNWVRKLVLVLLLAMGPAGCGPCRMNVHIAREFTPAPGARVHVGAVEVAAEFPGSETSGDLAAEMHARLEQELRRAGRLAAADDAAEGDLALSTTIVGYEPGDVFVRPFRYVAGSGIRMARTRLSVECTLWEGSREVGSIALERITRITEGPREWKRIFAMVAEDVVRALERELE